MNKIRVNLPLCAFAVFGGLLLCNLAVAIAGESSAKGAMILTFHKNSGKRLKSERFHVVANGTKVRWQNFQDSGHAETKASNPVYEVPPGDTFHYVVKKPKNTGDSSVARRR